MTENRAVLLGFLARLVADLLEGGVDSTIPWSGASLTCNEDEDDCGCGSCAWKRQARETLERLRTP